VSLISKKFCENCINLKALRRGNHLGLAGWDVVMTSLMNCFQLEQLDDIACQDLIKGFLIELQLSGHQIEEGFAASFVQYIPRSASTLKSLDLR
jgi:hypothetical protein